MVSCLPNEMLRYELETQGVRSDTPMVNNRTQLCNLIESRNYKPGRQPVAISYKEDIAQCRNYLVEWMSKFEKANKNREVSRSIFS